MKTLFSLVLICSSLVAQGFTAPETPESRAKAELLRVSLRAKMPLFYITVSGHDCDHDAIPARATSRLAALFEASDHARNTNDKAAIAFLSAPVGAVTVWTEKEWLDAVKSMGDFNKRCGHETMAR